MFNARALLVTLALGGAIAVVLVAFPYYIGWFIH